VINRVSWIKAGKHAVDQKEWITNRPIPWVEFSRRHTYLKAISDIDLPSKEFLAEIVLKILCSVSFFWMLLSQYMWTDLLWIIGRIWLLDATLVVAHDFFF
jgi:hypothetical protein